MKISLWFAGQTDLARRYSKVRPDRNPEESDYLWIPTSIIEGTTKFPEPSAMPLHIVKLPDWFVNKHDL